MASFACPRDFDPRDSLTGIERNLLSQPRPALVLRDIALNWLAIISGWLAVWAVPSPWILLLAIPLIGNRYYALFIIGHDGLHRRLHGSLRKNDLINDVLILGPILAITRLNRSNHMEHHKLLGQSEDPDYFKYRSRTDLSRTSLALSYTGAPLVLRAIRNVFLDRTKGQAKGERSRYTLRDIVIIGAWQLALTVGLTLLFGWWGYLVLWVMPVAAFTVAFDLLRVFCEHSLESDSEQVSSIDRMIMVESSPLERTFFAPANMNHHVAHHLWPTIPYFNLPAATSILEVRTLSKGGSIERRTGYCSYLYRCIKAARR